MKWAIRSREVREATWDEVDLDVGVWTVPGDRTKMGNEHRMALSGRAITLPDEARVFRENDLVFPPGTGRTMSDSTLSKLLRDLDIGAAPHGFRSTTFRSWCGGLANAPREVAEALGHKVGNVVEQAYARSDLFEKPRHLWSLGPAISPVNRATSSNSPEGPEREVSSVRRRFVTAPRRSHLPVGPNRLATSPSRPCSRAEWHRCAPQSGGADSGRRQPLLE